ncbi:pyridoxal-phosphate dependent enzyme [Saccharopolyspora sp. NPDC000995]
MAVSRGLADPHEENIVSLGEGFTPLLAAPRLAAELGIADLRIKDGAQNPTGSFKARGMVAAVPARAGTRREGRRRAVRGQCRWCARRLRSPTSRTRRSARLRAARRARGQPELTLH